MVLTAAIDVRLLTGRQESIGNTLHQISGAEGGVLAVRTRPLAEAGLNFVELLKLNDQTHSLEKNHHA